MFILPEEYWRIAKTPEKGLGVFAQKYISAGTIIGDYLGTVINIAEYDTVQDAKGLYLMYYTDQRSIYPDILKPGIHRINHACQPNCWMYVYKGHTLFFALRNIKPGEELTISYLLSPKDDACNPCTHNCLCESRVCTGSMHLPKHKYEMWQSFLKKQKKKMKIPAVTFGDRLPQLKSYPTIDHTNPIYFAMTPH